MLTIAGSVSSFRRCRILHRGRAKKPAKHEIAIDQRRIYKSGFAAHSLNQSGLLLPEGTYASTMIRLLQLFHVADPISKLRSRNASAFFSSGTTRWRVKSCYGTARYRSARTWPCSPRVPLNPNAVANRLAISRHADSLLSPIFLRSAAAGNTRRKAGIP